MPFLKKTGMKMADETSMGAFYLIVGTVQQSPSSKTIEFLEALSPSEDDNYKRKHIANAVEGLESRLCAQEPMAQLKSRQSVEEAGK